MIKRSTEVNKTHAHVTPSKREWISASSELKGLSFIYFVMQDRCRVELYIYRGKDSEQENEQIFDQLHTNREAIETAFGAPFHGSRLKAKRHAESSTRVRKVDIVPRKTQWPQIQDKTIHDMDRLEKALQPFLKQLLEEGS